MKTVEVGTELPPLTVTLRREDLVRYAGASGDFNPIHWSDRMAAALGLPGVIAHGTDVTEQVLARREGDRDVARHAEAEHVLEVDRHARSIAMAPDRVDLVAIGEPPVAQAREGHRRRADHDAVAAHLRTAFAKKAAAPRKMTPNKVALGGCSCHGNTWRCAASAPPATIAM